MKRSACRAVLSALVLTLVWAMPAKAATVVINPTLDFLLVGPCHVMLDCSFYNSPVYEVAGGSTLLFGTAHFSPIIDFRAGPVCPTLGSMCGAMIGSAGVRFSFSPGDLSSLTGAEDLARQRIVLCENVGGEIHCFSDPLVLAFAVPQAAIGIQLIIGGSPFGIVPAEIPTSVPLPLPAGLLAMGLAILIFFRKFGLRLRNQIAVDRPYKPMAVR